MHLPAHMPKKAAEDSPSPWAPAAHVGDLKEAFGYGFTLA